MCWTDRFCGFRISRDLRFRTSGGILCIYRMTEDFFAGLEENPYVYFVHSYYLKAADEQIVKATTQYSTTIHASVESGNTFACQFHPEKSGTVGLSILKNFAKLQGGNA